ncbi:MAG: T9SS type A sorting domain-containing protein [Taibaiella sp.]|jgi:hypothetical protein
MIKQYALWAFLSIFIFTRSNVYANTVILGNGVTISQIPNQKGAVVISGNFTKPVTSDQVTLSIKYKDNTDNWITVWCKAFAAGDQYNEQLKATFELPASGLSAYDIKMELSAGTTLTNWQSIAWQNSVNHYKQRDYTTGNCDLDENQYTILFTPKKAGTILQANGNVTGIKDRVNSSHIANKLNDIVFSIHGNGVLDNANSNAPCINLTNPANLTEIASTQNYIYTNSNTSPWEFSYYDPVYLFAGKFPSTGFFITFSHWAMPESEGGDAAGRGYLDFTNPNSLVNRYFNLYNYIQEHLPDVITNQEPIVIAISKITGLRIYKANGSYVSLNATSNYNGTNTYGYPSLYNILRGPGSESFSLKGISNASFYGMGAIRNHEINGQPRPLTEIESEISKFINYVGIFGNASGSIGTGACAEACININPGANPDYIPVDWTLAPNSYIFTGKDTAGADVDGLYIPVKKAYAMWENGGEFMRDASGNYTPIPSGAATAGIYWEDEHGLIKSVSLEGSGANAKIKVIVNKLKEGNAVISYRVDNKIYWTWHVWVTDDPTNGSTYHHGFERDKNGDTVTDWRWMDRNLGATNANFVGNDWQKSGGLQYQWGRKDPFPPLVYKDGSFYEVTGEVGSIRHRSAVYTIDNTAANGQSKQLPMKYRGNYYGGDSSTTYDAPSENIRYSINNPINFILAPMFTFKIGEQVNNSGENYFKQYLDPLDNKKKYGKKELTTWFSKEKYKYRNPNKPDENIAWDLWGDINGGKKTNIGSDKAQEREISSRYSMKSPYDPCPCNWRVPSSYATVSSDSSKASPWGSHTGNGIAVTFSPNSLNPDYPGIKIYPGLGYDFTNVPNRNIGKISINGNYETYPNEVSLGDGTNVASGKVPYPYATSQDHGADGSLLTSTFSSGSTEPEPLQGAQGFDFIADPYNFKTSVGWDYLNFNGVYHTALGADGVRCIKDPNNTYMPSAFKTEYVAAPTEEYPLETLKTWTKDANSYIADPAVPNRIIKIPLRKAYAMQKLYLSENEAMPSGNVKTPMVEWTTSTNLISSVEILPGATIETDTLKVTVANGEFGNAVVGFHLGDLGWVNGSLQDKAMWSWHVWAPTVDPRLNTITDTTESATTNGTLTANQQFVNPVRSQGVPVGVPMATTFMNMDLGAWNPLPATLDYSLIQNSGGLHYQWGRKDPIPVFLRAGGFWAGGMKYYTIFRQVGINSADGSILYSGAINENTYLQNFSREYSAYSAAANVMANDKKEIKIKKILKYATENPLTYLYHNPSTSTNQYIKVKDWLANENNLFMERWGHANSKSPYDPCPEGWRIPDAFSAGSKEIENNFEKGTNPWFYNGYQVSPFTGNNYGLSTAYPHDIYDETYSPSNKRYPGKVVINPSYPATRFGWIFEDSRYTIGRIPNNGIRGADGGNQLFLDTTGGSLRLRHNATGLWLSNPADYYSGKAAHLRIDPITGPILAQKGKMKAGATSSPQAAMSCRCAKINYDANGNEIGRYDPNAIAVPHDALQKASKTFDTKEINGLLQENKITVFPNPVKDILSINATDTKEYYYQIYNMAGQMVKQGQFNSGQTDVSSLTAGTYLIRINNSESVVKIVKQ